MTSTTSSSTPPTHNNAPPPWLTVALVGILLSSSIYYFPSLESIDEISTPATFRHVIFPELLTVSQMACIRLTFALIILLDCLYAFLYGEWDQDTDYYSGSRFKRIQGIPFRGMLKSNKPFPASFISGCMTLSSFTMWAWFLEGVTFALMGWIPLTSSSMQQPHHVWILRITFVLWETVAPMALLVSAIVKFVLWPTALAGRDRNQNNLRLLKHPVALLEHNANSLFCFIEMGLLGGMPVRSTDVAVAVLLGIIYQLYSWAMMYQWTTHHAGPQFIYPFFDTTLGIATSIYLLGLLATLGTFYTLVAVADQVITHLGGGIAQHVGALVLLGLLFCRFRD